VVLIREALYGSLFQLPLFYLFEVWVTIAQGELQTAVDGVQEVEHGCMFAFPTPLPNRTAF